MPAGEIPLRVLPCGRLILPYFLPSVVADTQSKPDIFPVAGLGAGTPPGVAAVC